MVGRFGSREICDVTFKAATDGFTLNGHSFKAGQPVFVIDTATASSMEQATTTVYAQGGKGYNRLIAWEGEKTVTFNVTDALISPLGLAMLTGAGLADASATEVKHVHVTVDAAVSGGAAKVSLATLIDELGLSGDTAEVNICNDANIKTYATILDNNGAITGWIDAVVVKTAIAKSGADAEFTVYSEAKYKQDGSLDEENSVKLSAGTVKLDFYVYMTTGVTEITIEPSDFGGTFYVEADTLYRNQDGKDMAATLTFPKAKIQSGFTIAMAPTGDPSTFDFVMDAMPGYTYFDSTKKVVCDITIVGGSSAANETKTHTVDENGHMHQTTTAADPDDTP